MACPLLSTFKHKKAPLLGSGAKWEYISTIEIFSIFDIRNVNKYMFKKFVLMDNSLLQYRNNFVSLDTFSNVIINRAKFPVDDSQNFLRAKVSKQLETFFYSLIFRFINIKK